MGRRQWVAALAVGAALAAVLAALPLLRLGAGLGASAGSSSAGWMAALGAAGVALYLVAAGGLWPEALPWALGVLAVEYVASLLARPSLDPLAPVAGLLLFCAAELGWLALERGRGQGLWQVRALLVVGVGLGGAAVGWLALLTPALPLGGGLALTALGVAAALGALAAAALVAARR